MILNVGLTHLDSEASILSQTIHENHIKTDQDSIIKKMICES